MHVFLTNAAIGIMAHTFNQYIYFQKYMVILISYYTNTLLSFLSVIKFIYILIYFFILLANDNKFSSDYCKESEF